MDHLRVFGCNAYAHIPKDKRGKFDVKTRKCILVGYGNGTKGYRLYHTGQQKIFHSHDMSFNEEEKTNEETFMGLKEVICHFRMSQLYIKKQLPVIIA